LIVFSVNDADMFFVNFFSWWFGNAMGQMLLTPILLILYRDYKMVNYRLFTLVILFFLLFCYVIFVFSPINNFVFLLSVTISLIVLIMVYTGFVYAMISVLLLALVSLTSMHFGVGAFTLASNSMDRSISISIFLPMSSLYMFTVY